MSSFSDMMFDDGFSDPQEYMDYLEEKALGRDYSSGCRHFYRSNDNYDFEAGDYSDDHDDMDDEF